MRSKRFLVLAGAVIVPLIIGAVSPYWASQARTFVLDLARPFLEFQTQAIQFFKVQIQQVAEWPKLRTENQALRTELQNLKAEIESLEEIKRENVRFEALLALGEKTQGESRVAKVIARDPSHWSHFIVINKGSRDGVQKNTVLVHPDGLIGKVIAAGPRSSRAILLIDGASRTSAMNQRTRDVGLIEGTGSSTFKMTYLDRESQIQVGDVIISSGLGGIYPKGIPIGKVEVIGDEKDHLNLYALVKPFVSFSKLEEVLCVSSETND